MKGKYGRVTEPIIKELRQRVDEGYNFVAYSLDIRMLEAIWGGWQ